MSRSFTPGDRVRTSAADPPLHNRLPRYARGVVGTVVAAQGRHPRPDFRSRGLASAPEIVYTVRFPARELFGGGDHEVTVDIWEHHLQPEAGEAGR
jgi:hypothetical protein